MTLEEGETEGETEGSEEGAAGMWRRFLGLCRKLHEKVQLWWKVRQWALPAAPWGASPRGRNVASPVSNVFAAHTISVCVCDGAGCRLSAVGGSTITSRKVFSQSVMSFCCFILYNKSVYYYILYTFHLVPLSKPCATEGMFGLSVCSFEFSCVNYFKSCRISRALYIISNDLLINNYTTLVTFC